MIINGVTITDTTDFDKLAGGALAGHLGDSLSTTDNAPQAWLFDAWPQLRGTPFAGRLARAIGNCLLGSDAALTYSALLFFSNFPDAGELGQLSLEQAYRNRVRFRGVYPPDGGTSADLEWWLMRAIASLAGETGHGAEMKLLEKEALNPSGKVVPIISTLVNLDAAWFASHREQVLKLHPEVKEIIETIEARK